LPIVAARLLPGILPLIDAALPQNPGHIAMLVQGFAGSSRGGQWPKMMVAGAGK
jgi:hypothetical protein